MLTHLRRMLGAMLLLACSAHAQAWQDTLRARDVDRDGTIDAYYDTSLDITWLADWRWWDGDGTFEQHSTAGLGLWEEAMARAGAFVLHGATAWRLPALRPASGDTENQRSSEMSVLFYDTLGLTPDSYQARAITCESVACAEEWTLPIRGVTPWDRYWTNVAFPVDEPFQEGVTQLRAYTFDFRIGQRGTRANSLPGVATFVHDGDVFTTVAAVPEPSTFALLLLGLAALSLRRKLHSTNIKQGN